MRGHPSSKSRWVPRLHKHRSWTRELADQTLSAADTRDDATASYTFHDILAIPSHEMTVVNDILFAFDKLLIVNHGREGVKGREITSVTYVLSNNSPKTGDPENSRSTNLIHE